MQKRLNVLLGIFLILLSILALIFIVGTLLNRNSGTEAPRQPDYELSAASERTLTGSVLEWNLQESFFRLAVADESIYSISLQPDVLVTMGGIAVVLAEVDPLLQVTVEVVALPLSEPYDFVAKTIQIPTLADLSVEERADRIQIINTMMREQ